MARDEIVERIAEPVPRLACRKCKVSFDVANEPMLGTVACPACGKEQKVPARLSGFLLIEALGKGGMAAVYRAYDETLGRMVAIKILRGSANQDEDAVQSFIREARAAAQLNHRNIVQVYTVGQTKGQAFMVMELLDGGRFDEMISADREVDEAKVLEIGIGVAEGLKSANEIGLIHGDIKPANILFDRSGTPKIADFGLARFQGSGSDRGEVWGTPYYIAPEKVRKQKEDHRSDIYSLGATLYHALGGQPPFDGRTATDVVVARLKEPPIRVDTLRPNLHASTVEVVSRMLEADRMRRYPTYPSLLADLHKALDDVKANPRSADSGRRLSSGRAGRRVMRWVALGLILAAAGGGAAWWLTRPGKPEPEETAVDATADPSAGTEAETVPDPDVPDPVVAADPLQPFSPEEGARLAGVVARMNTVASDAIDQEILSQFQALGRDHAGRPWYTFWYAFTVWLNGDAEQVERRVRGLRDLSVEPLADGGIAPVSLVQALAHVLAGEAFAPPGPARADPEPVETEAVEAEAAAAAAVAEAGADGVPGEPVGEAAPDVAPAADAGVAEAPGVEAAVAAEGEAGAVGPETAAVEEAGSALPEWYLDLADFVLGLRELWDMETRAVGRLRLARYRAAEPDEKAAWAYAGQAVAQRWLERVDAWEALVASVSDRVAAGEGDAVLAQMQDVTRSPQWGALRAETAAAFRAARNIKTRHDRRLLQQQQQAEQQVLQERIAAEREILTPVRAELAQWIRQVDFRRARSVWDERTGHVETDEVKADVAAMRDALVRMDGLKRFLAAEVQRQPYPHAQQQLRGAVVQVSDTGVGVALAGGVGTAERTWAQAGPRIFSEMVTFYLSGTQVPEPERGEHASALAVFFYLNGAERPASVAAANAIRWNSEMADGLRRTVPDAVPAEAP